MRQITQEWIDKAEGDFATGLWDSSASYSTAFFIVNYSDRSQFSSKLMIDLNCHINEDRSSIQNINLVGIASPFGESQ
jgi:hypothetical protein